MPRTKPKSNDVQMMDDQVGIRLRKLRRGRMWSPSQAVEKINAALQRMGSAERMNERVLLAWERGDRRPRLGPKLAATAEVYGVSGDWLLVGEE